MFGMMRPSCQLDCQLVRRPAARLLLGVTCFLSSIQLAVSVRADDSIAFFEKRIRPVLVEHCYGCHSREAGKQQGGLLLDSPDGMRRGGDSGAAVVPRDAEQSLLLEAIRYESFEMPPEGRLPDRVVADFEHWIEAGAADPRPSTATPAANSPAETTAKTLPWSMQPLAVPSLPDVPEAAWSRSEIDHFILAGLEQAGLSPTSAAHPAQLCRRLYLTLIGLPPTLEELDAFLAEVAEQGTERATSRLVDALLASVRFGERWGRHWLDLARYSDTNIGSTQRPWTNAWLYRNYVIRCFNEDLPYDQFVLEQIAGDMLPASDAAERANQLVATGFLALATRDLTERDAFQIQLDGIDDALETMSRTVLGLSVGCARCHDHKFDPIPTADYYALAGILRSSFLTGIKERTAIFNGDMLVKHSPTTPRPKLPEASVRATAVTEFAGDEYGRIGDMRVHIAGSYRRLGELVPRGFIQALGVSDVEPIPSGESGRRQLAAWLTSSENPLTPRVLANRIWGWSLGQPLVESVDNFGNTGRQPSHPDLLDWLAVRIRDRHRWQLKPAIRDILLSSTWRQDTAVSKEAMAIDPGNRLIWRMNRRRLEAEQLHDTLLAISGELDRRPVEQTLPEFGQENTTNTSTLPIDPSVRRHRAVYLPVFRKDMPTDLDVLRLFDFPDPKFSRGHRETNTLPAQSLYVWNSPLAHLAADRIATRMLADENRTVEQRAALLVRWLFGRPADDATRKQVVKIYESFHRWYADQGVNSVDHRAWKRAIHTMLMSNEFLFVS